MRESGRFSASWLSNYSPKHFSFLVFLRFVDYYFKAVKWEFEGAIGFRNTSKSLNDEVARKSWKIPLDHWSSRSWQVHLCSVVVQNSWICVL